MSISYFNVYLLYMLLKSILSFIFPNHCLLCSNIIIDDRINSICIECLNRKLDYIHSDGYIRCDKCGKVKEYKDSVCECSIENNLFDECKSLLYYNNTTKELIHKMKFEHRYMICVDFGVLLSFHYTEYIKKFDALIYVPLVKKRFLERGYNQSEVIARVISDKLNIKYIDNLVLRKKNTKALSSIGDKEKRKEAIKNAFEINKKIINKYKDCKNILIIDDVFTTGSTINEMCKELRKLNYIENIGVLTVART